MEKTYKKHFYTFPNGGIRYHGLVTVTFDGKTNWIDGTPVEDFGDYALYEDYVESEVAYQQWFNAMYGESC